MYRRESLLNCNNGISLVKPWELIDPTNPALKRIVDSMSTFSFIPEKVFYRNVDKVVAIVCSHFDIDSKE